MKTKIITQLIALLILSFVSKFNAQDIYFSQWQTARTFVNPALAGKDSGVYINTAYRNQWPGLASNYVTYYAGADAYIKKLKTGVGFNYVDDNMASNVVGSKRYSIQLSPKFNIKNKLRISVGLEAAFVQLKIDPSKFSYGNQLDPKYGFIYKTQTTFDFTNRNYFDYNGSILLENKLGNIGFVYSHILQPNQSFYKSSESPLPSKFTLHAITKQFSLSSKKTWNMRIGFIGMRQSNFNFAKLSFITSYKWFELLTGFRRSDITIGAGIQKKQFRFSYSYDINISKLKNSQGSHELNIGYRF